MIKCGFKQLARVVGVGCILISVVIYADLLLYWATAGNYMLWDHNGVIAGRAGFDPHGFMPAFAFIIQKVLIPVIGFLTLIGTGDVFDVS